jgi:hypothetical protein
LLDNVLIQYGYLGLQKPSIGERARRDYRFF